MAIFDFFQVYSLVNVCLVVACVAAVIYLVGSIASYLLQWLCTGRKGALFAFLFKPWTDNSLFTCRYCGKRKPVEEMQVVGRFFPSLPCCRDCWKSLE